MLKIHSKIKSLPFLLISLTLVPFLSLAQQLTLPRQNDRWQIMPDGAIHWQPTGRLPHSDHIEMAGEKVSLWVKYTVDTNKASQVIRTLVFPTFRMLPDETRSHVSFTFSDDELPEMFVNGRKMNLPAIKVTDIYQHGIMKIEGITGGAAPLKIERSLFPSAVQPMALEMIRITNRGNTTATIEMNRMERRETTDPTRSKVSPHTVIVETINSGSHAVKSGETLVLGIAYRITDQPEKPFTVNLMAEQEARQNRVNEISQPLQLITPDSVLNTEFAFAKLRATESIFKTKIGYLHSPGGLEYYAAIWANDQAEYVSPFFAYTGDRIANASAINCYKLFARHMNPDYRPIPSSIVAEGDAVWQGAGDRGDQAMIAYGASRFALTYGNADTARMLWPLIKWCLEYSRRHINNEGVVTSDADELEGRFPSGKANLSTNGLYYDALVSAAKLGAQLHIAKSETDGYAKAAAALKANIEKYFGATVQGYPTYRYYETNNVLRSWICIPLTMGIYTRAKGTIDALFSPALWTKDGLATEAGQTTFWDRSTLYALRGVLQAGETARVMPFLHYYSQRRLLGEHVPYPVEAYPEGNQRHLSAESGLYCRIFIEGMFGIRPTALNGFDCSPRLPADWNKMSLNNIHAFGAVFDLKVEKKDEGHIKIIVTQNGKVRQYIIKNGDTINIRV
ncbi:hypothetical protein [Mucilaginibacter sp. L3T2-6]|uniref:hypothetical protein n=1 Tax=Mucilaginibacter sp. L3T2-6 TaxID=3062491 RepID=UPI002675A1CD|nr:hypothetical protein [Mucilaginibacter sp. L3T2-6]MDO3644911.1 hypothetical protein [Mucilaginibacter sp. L3T2-6]MDV6217362.1 hypothetical protein [Mucilaginibacter sp. L3T2-6]